MKPAPPVMHTRLFVRAIPRPLLVLTGTGFRELWRRFAPQRQLLSERKQFVGRHAAGDEHRELLSRALERRHDHQVVTDLIVLADWAYRHAEELRAPARLQTHPPLQPP